MYCTGCSVIIHHHPQRLPLISQDASCANYDSVQFKIAQLIPPPPKYNMFLKQWAESIQSFKTWCLASRRWSHFPPNDSATLLQRHGPEAWKLQGAGRCKDVASSLASHWDLLSGCLEAAWAYWPPFAPYARRGLAVTSDEDLCVMA